AGDFYKFVFCELISDIVLKTHSDEETSPLLFKLLYVCFNEINNIDCEDIISLKKLMCFFEAKYLRIIGYGPSLKSCSKCGAEIGSQVASLGKEKVFFSNKFGGIICQDCYRNVGFAIEKINNNQNSEGTESKEYKEYGSEKYIEDIESHRASIKGNAVTKSEKNIEDIESESESKELTGNEKWKDSIEDGIGRRREGGETSPAFDEVFSLHTTAFRLLCDFFNLKIEDLRDIEVDPFNLKRVCKIIERYLLYHTDYGVDSFKYLRKIGI
ncbi:MAG: DNA repair protein RecO C-terminal domain-containing protein, partial [Actinobacteria bacterium]|nr:DNA repair protein RecO C-terminal domain-containing protein [Actinomycetota bacterium]